MMEAHLAARYAALLLCSQRQSFVSASGAGLSSWFDSVRPLSITTFLSFSLLPSPSDTTSFLSQPLNFCMYVGLSVWLTVLLFLSACVSELVCL